jgi:uncharacterized protein YehS (DUF1456 family)
MIVYMLTNDILRRVRFALDINDAKVSELFSLTGSSLDSGVLSTMFLKEDDEGFVLCPDAIAHRFFSGLILDRRGVRPGVPNEPVRSDRLTGNDVLWYIRIALSLRDTDVADIIRKGGINIDKTELSAFFRKKDHSNFRSCQDQLLRGFLAGLTATYRPVA